MVKLQELKTLMKENDLPYNYMNKDELIAIAIDKNLISPSKILQSKSVIKKREDIDKYAHLKGIRTNPKTVKIHDIETNTTTVYKSLYKACRALSLNHYNIVSNNGKVFRDRYEIKVS